MGYYMRYFATDNGVSMNAITLAELEAALKKTHSGYAIAISAEDPFCGDLMYRQTLLGEITINRPGDEIFEDEIQAFKELLPYSRSQEKGRVMQVLETATAIVAVRAVWNGDGGNTILEHIDPLWDWLQRKHPGLLHCDGDGFYNGYDLILEMSVTI